MAESLLWNLMVVDSSVLQQGLFEFCPALEAGGLDDFGDAPIEAFDHAIGLRMLGRDQAVLDLVFQASLVEGMVACGFSFAGGAKPVGELLAVIGQHLLDGEGAVRHQVFQEGGGGGCLLVGMDFPVDPPAGPVDGHEQIAAAVLIGHSGADI